MAGPNEETDPTLKELYPQLDEEQLRQASETLDRYLALALRIFERINSKDPPGGPIDADLSGGRIGGEQQIPPKSPEKPT